jgi:hypothetical protein
MEEVGIVRSRDKVIISFLHSREAYTRPRL